MPYSVASDPSLPSNVKSMPAKRRRQWVHIFNSAMKNGKPEANAFAMANGVTNRKDYDDYSPTPSEVYVQDDSWEFQISQEQANYDPTGGVAGKACANCHWFDSPNSCFVVAGEISPTGVSDLWMAQPATAFTPIPVTIVKSLKEGGNPADDDEEWIPFADDEPDAFYEVVTEDKAVLTAKKRNKLPKTSFAWVDAQGKGHLPINDEARVRAAMSRWNQTNFDSVGAKASAKSKILAAAKRYGIDASGFSSKAIAPSGAGMLSGLRALVGKLAGGTSETPKQLRLYKQKDGRVRFYTAWSNNFMDKEGEIFTAAAHKEFVDWATAAGEYPELWLWHTKGSRFGQVDWLDTTGDGFVHASGLIDAGKEALAEKLVQEDVGVSHGFFGLQQKNLIHWYRSYELSVLPLKNAAVWTTSFNLLDARKAIEMGFTPARRKFFTDMGIAEDQIKSWESQTEGLHDTLKSMGLESKAADFGVVVEPPPTPEAVAEQTFRKEMLTTLMGIQDVVTGLAGQVKAIDERTKDIKSGDAVIAAAMNPANGATVQASKSNDNVVATGPNSSVPDATKEFFDKTVLGSLLGAPA